MQIETLDSHLILFLSFDDHNQYYLQ